MATIIGMKSSLRETLIQSHVAAVAIAVLLLGAFDCAVQSAFVPLGRAATYAVTAIAILDIPYSSPGVTVQDRLMLANTGFLLVGVFADLGAAWLVARWVYGVGPISALTKHRADVTRRDLA